MQVSFSTASSTPVLVSILIIGFESKLESSDSAEHFLCLFAICTLSLKKSLCKSFAHFCIELFVFLQCSKNSLYISDTSYLSDTWFTSISFHFFGCLFTFLKVLFASQKFNFYMVPFIYFFFFAYTFALYLRTHCITQSDSSKSLMVLALTSMICVCAQSLSCVWLFAAPQTVACQAPLPMGFSRQECWGEVPFPTPGDLTNSGSNPCLLHLLHWQADSLPLMTTGKPHPWSILS